MANINPCVGIIIPIYNVEKYLKECLDSVINQTYKNLQIVLVDDGSTDNSFAIAKEYFDKDKRIALIKKKKNTGMGSSRNMGLDYLSQCLNKEKKGGGARSI
ncbi:glycosyltransferase family A protein [Helicobacter anseris]|uniref:glycosyltransferase family A protein n=1 Tax=Helicobacter anseris TaxID=375926 RepID=UPI0014734671|nr:glycosyltransferase family A protein [Helicobacter anseris]